MACLPLSTFCHECILNDPSQTLYTKDPDRGRPVMRNPSAAQINKLHQSEQLKADEGLSLLTTALAAGAGADGAVRGSAGAKISTPDRHIAAGLLAACMAPFPHAAKKDRRELSSTTSASAGAAGGATIATTTTHSGSAAAAVAKAPAAQAAGVVTSAHSASAPQVAGNVAPPSLQMQMPLLGGGVQFHMNPHSALPVQVIRGRRTNLSMDNPYRSCVKKGTSIPIAYTLVLKVGDSEVTLLKGCLWCVVLTLSFVFFVVFVLVRVFAFIRCRACTLRSFSP